VQQTTGSDSLFFAAHKAVFVAIKNTTHTIIIKYTLPKYAANITLLFFISQITIFVLMTKVIKNTYIISILMVKKGILY